MRLTDSHVIASESTSASSQITLAADIFVLTHSEAFCDVRDLVLSHGVPKVALLLTVTDENGIRLATFVCITEQAVGRVTDWLTDRVINSAVQGTSADTYTSSSA